MVGCGRDVRGTGLTRGGELAQWQAGARVRWLVEQVMALMAMWWAAGSRLRSSLLGRPHVVRGVGRNRPAAR